VLTEGAPSAVLDASALLAFLHREPGHQAVAAVLQGAEISSVNWSEVSQRALTRGTDLTGLRSDLIALGLVIVPFSTKDAESAATLWSSTRALGLSLGDRACLALGLVRGAMVLTADRQWQNLNVGVPVRLIR
jgi:ribonuclease VapC